ncbi:hypothetical protein B37_00475 [Bacillus licheniformis]|nr:hypothetical protein B37_00475 [Bacillus licheniformis]ARW41661.1 hypothetical protein S100141_00338 [Bacillus licheniformis]ARW56513.1 hypothetical protein S100027_04549 [Bacillus licheniformis]
MSHFKIIYKGGGLVQSKTVYAKHKIDACTRFMNCYPYNEIVDVFPISPEGSDVAAVA